MEEPGQDRLGVLVEGMTGLRRAFLAAIVAAVVGVVGAVAFAASLFGVAAAFTTVTGEAASLEGLAEALAGAIVIIVVFAILYLALYLYFLVNLRRASKALARLRGELGIGATGALLSIIGLLLAVPGLLLLVAGIISLAESLAKGIGPAGLGLVLGGLGLLLLGGLLALIGEILVAIMVMRVEGLREEGLPVRGSWNTAGILMLIGVVLSLLPSDLTAIIGGILLLVSFILAYMYAGETLEAARGQAASATPELT